MPDVISLAALQAPLSHVDLGEGGVHAVTPITGIGMELLEQSRDGGDWRNLYIVAQQCLPTCSLEQVMALTIQQIDAVIKIASGQAQEVMRLLGNGVAAPETTPAPPAPATPSGS